MRGGIMKALITLESGKTVRIDTHGLLLTLMDKTGNPTHTTLLQKAPVLVPGRPLIFADSDGMETTEEKVVQIIYSSDRT
jgi:hypothetical protein